MTTASGRVPDKLELQAVLGMPMVGRGDDIARLLVDCLTARGVSLQNDDVVVVAQKIISKAEGRLVDLQTVEPSGQARNLAAKTDKDPRLVELILRESTSIVRHRRGVVVVRHRQGFVMANAGIDQSNVPDDHALLLPEDIDRSAAALKARLEEIGNARVGVIVSDSLGRAWRRGTIGHALGVAGLECLIDLRGSPDLYGREMVASEVAIADELAAAAAIVMGETSEAKPAVLVRGLRIASATDSGKTLLRDEAEDMFS